MHQCLLCTGVFLLWATSFAEALKCMKCYGSSFEDCDLRGRLTECQKNQQSCQTTIRRYHDKKLTVEKRCKDGNACQNNQIQNNASFGNSTKCNADQAYSFCTCCCDTDVCNGGISSCYSAALPLPKVSNCPAQEQTFPHGNINCYGGEEQSQICQYECTSPDYSLYPKSRGTNVCTSNSTWSIERPCCARACPPYFLLDSVFLFNYKSEELGRIQILQSIKDLVRYEVIAWDAAQEAVMYFSGQPQLQTVVTFADYNYDSEEFARLVKRRMNPINKGPVNFGAAIRYATNNMFTKEAGARDSRVPKIIQIATDQNPDDPVDAVAAAKEARARGIVMYIFAFADKGTTFNTTLLSNIVSEEHGHLYVFDGQYNNLTQAHYQDLIEHFCSNPCNHVLHGHGV